MLTYKGVEEKLSEESLGSLVGMFIYVPINPLFLKNGDQVCESNVWFGGLVAGFQIDKVKYNFQTGEYFEEYKNTYSIIMTDGASYLISNQSEIQIITEDELNQLMVEYAARQVLANPEGVNGS